MLLQFQAPYPDEIFYSICARIDDRLKYSSKHKLTQALFGRRGIPSSLITFPVHLAYFVDQLPLNHHYSLEYFINQHTLLPYCLPFAESDKADLLRQKLEGHMERCSLGNSFSPDRLVSLELKYCSACVEEDRMEFGECYWHRLHQLRGIEVCPRHWMLLQRSGASALDKTSLQSAERTIKTLEELPIQYTNDNHLVLIHLAEGAKWLLAHGYELVAKREHLVAQFRILLTKMGFASYNDTVRYSKLLPEFRRKYSDELLELIGCQLDLSSTKTWLAGLLAKQSTYSPLEYLLIMDFLDYYAEDFFALELKNEPFGPGPWRCFNPVCHEKSPSIHKYEIRRYVRCGQTRTYGIFTCLLCGFTYVRTPYVSYSAGKNYDRILTHGYVWETKLRQWLLDKTKTLKEICDRFELDERQPRYYASRWKLSNDDVSSNRRFAWNALGFVTPKIDLQLSQLIHQAAADMRRSTKYPPKRITEKRLLRKTNLSRRFKVQQAKLPLMTSAMLEEVDTDLTYALRRLEWLVEYCLKNEQWFPPKAFSHFVLPSHMKWHPEVKAAVDNAMERLDKFRASTPSDK